MLKFIVNKIGYLATSQTTPASHQGPATGYEPKDIISGPRHTTWRSTASGSQPAGAGYTLGGNQTADICVVTRLDLSITTNGTSIAGMYYNGSSWTALSTWDSSISKSDLIGPYQQDFVKEFTQENRSGFGIKLDRVSGTQCASFSKMYFGDAFDFGKNPGTRDVAIEILPEEDFLPLNGEEPYAVERRITFNWSQVLRSKVTSFKALKAIDNSPFFIYDDAGDIFQWKLEHVILESMEEKFFDQTWQSFKLTVRRLQHYDYE